MYNNQYYTCEQIDERLLQGYLDDYNSQTGQSLTKAQFLTKLGSLFSKEGTIDNTLTQIGYYECDTAAGTAAKVITVANYSLFAGGSMKVKFVNKNTANNATLNINSQGAKALYYNGVRVSSTNTWDANEVVEIYYDGTSYYANNVKGSSGDGVFDISVYNLTEGQPTKYADLATALGPNGQNVPVQYRKGGMSVKYVQSSDNNYVKFFCTADEFTTDVTQWQGVDDEPTAGSKNLVMSGGVDKKTGNIVSKEGIFSIVDESGYIGAIIGGDGMTIKDVCIKINGSFLSIKNLITEISQSLTETEGEVSNIGDFLSKSFKEIEDFYITDENGYYCFGINKTGKFIGGGDFKQLISVLKSILIEGNAFYVTDENGYIAFQIDKNGNIKPNFCNSVNFRGVSYPSSGGVVTIPNSAVQIPYAGKLELPNKINILQGTIESLYYEQMLGNGFLRDYVLLGQNLPYIPQTDMMFINTNVVGLIVRSINLFNGFGERIEQKDININIVDKTVSGSVKICVIGDSMTENPKKLYELANLASKDNNFDITFLGARNATGTDSEGNTRTVKHCGYSGKNIIDVCRLESYGAGLPNIFYDSTLQTTNKFSIAKGIEAMGDIPDIIIIDHGANQSGNAWSDVKGCYNFIISDIATYNIAHNTDIKIVICVQQPGGLSQVVANYSIPSKWSRNWSPTKLMDYVEEYDNRENEGIFLLPQYLIIDPYKDYPRADVPYSSRNTSLREVALDNVHMGINMNGYDSNHVYSYGEICTDGNQNGYVSLKNNNTEPLSDNKTDWAKTKDDVNAGYWKLADAYFAELKYIASL